MHISPHPVPFGLKIGLLLLLGFLVDCRAEIPAQDQWPAARVIDMHAHVFNAHDIPLDGILTRFHLNPPVNNILSRVLQEWTEPDPDAERLALMPPPPPSLTPADRNALERHTKTSGEQLIQGVKNKGALTVDELWANSDVALVAEALRQAQFPPGENDPEQPAVNSLTGADLEGYMRFIRIMCRTHVKIRTTLRDTYRHVDLFVHHMMDMDKVYGTSSSHRFEDQIVRAQRDDVAAGGEFGHFVAFDPFRRDDAIRLIREGYEHGALGIKFYPPSGYRPTQNFFPKRPWPWQTGMRTAWSSRYKGWEPKDLDAIIRAGFKEAAGLRLPIFSHCTPYGFQAAPGYGIRCDPHYWGELLKEKEFKSLRVCLGHAGGEAYWLSDPETDRARKRRAPVDEGDGTRLSADDLWNFGARAVELALEYENVYLDFGYIDGVLSGPGKDALVKRLSADLGRAAKNGDWKLGDRIVYGSDWHQIHKVKDYSSYLAAWDEVLRRVSNGAYRERILSRNAVRFLGLEEQMKREVLSTQRSKWEKLIK